MNSKSGYPATHPHIAVYTLVDRLTNEVRYVGKTVWPKRRLERHNDSNVGVIREWVDAMADEGRVPVMNVVDIVPLEEGKVRERQEMAKYDASRLLNSTASGGGSDDTFAKSRTLSQIEEDIASSTFIKDMRVGVTPQKRVVDIMALYSSCRSGPSKDKTGHDIRSYFNEQSDEYQTCVVDFFRQVQSINRSVLQREARAKLEEMTEVAIAADSKYSMARS